MKVINTIWRTRIKEIARIIECNELVKSLNTNLRIESKKKKIFSIAEYISDGKNLKIEPSD